MSHYLKIHVITLKTLKHSPKPYPTKDLSVCAGYLENYNSYNAVRRAPRAV